MLHDRLLSACGSELRVLINTQPNPRSAYRRRSLHDDCWRQLRLPIRSEPIHSGNDHGGVVIPSGLLRFWHKCQYVRFSEPNGISGKIS
jgi:hypothetical protein